MTDEEQEPIGAVTPGSDAAPDADDSADAPAFERPIDRFRRSGVGTVVAAGLIGLGDALEGRREREQPAIVQEKPAGLPGDVEVLLDINHPGEGVVVVHRRTPETDDT